MKLYQLLFFFFLLEPSPSANAQTGRIKNYEINGKLTDQTGRPVEKITLSVFNRQDTLHSVNTVISRQDGSFSFRQISPGSYYITAQSIGFYTYKSSWFEITGSNVLLPTIILKSESHELKEVTIEAKQPLLTVSGGKLIYNVEQSATAAGSTAFELLRRTPGISIDQNENLLLKGSSAVNVMMDGKMTYMSAQQLSNMLKSMSSDNISRIEVVTAPSAQYDAAGNAGIINIVSRKSNKQGYAANITTGATLGRYLLHSESITGNIKTRRFNFFGNLGYSYQHSYSYETSRQQLHTNSTDLIFDRAGINPHLSNYYTYKAGLDVYLGNKQQLGFVYTGSTDDWSKNAAGTTNLHDGTGQPVSVLQNRNYSKEPYYNNVYNLNYLYHIDTAGRILSADADYISYRNNSDGYLGSDTYSGDGQTVQSYQQINFHQPSYIDIRSLKTDLAYPVRGYNLKTGLKYSSVTINNNFRYDSLENNIRVPAPSLSDQFIYKEQIAAAYLSAGREWKSTSVNIGFRLEHTYSDGNSISTGTDTKRNYTNLFPSVSISRQLGKESKLDLSLSRRINRPNYGILNPARYFSDKYSYYQGNPTLTAEKSWIYALSYTLKDKYIAGLSYNRSDNFLSRSAAVDPVSGILISSNANYPHRDRIEAELVAPFEPASFWDITSTISMNYSRYPLTQLSGYVNVHKTAADLFVNQTFRLPGSAVLELMTRYTTPELNGVYLTRYYFSMDGGIKQSFLRKKLDARFAFADLFHTGWYWGYSISNTADYTYKNIPDSRRFSLSVIYHIGGKLTGGSQHRIEEQNRL